MSRISGFSVRLKLTFSYAGFLLVAGVLLLGIVWLFLLRGVPAELLIPSAANLPRAFNPHNFGPIVFGAAALIAMILLLAFGLLGGWFLAGQMLAPLTRITDATRLAANGSLTHRIGLEGRTDEFRELADAFDDMLLRLDAHVAEQRRFAANASHELRTPLTTIQTLLDVARGDPGCDCGALIERLHDVNARAIDMTEALLLLSRADQLSFARENVDLSLLAEEAAEGLLPFAEARGITIETSGDVALTWGSPALLLQMTTNLLHNAIVHNLAGPGSVWLITDTSRENVELIVENTGEALAPQTVSTLVEPFKRGAERIRADHAGVGLGLAIVKSIIQAHDGTLSLTPRTIGGLRVTVRLPISSPRADG
ncbi:sensor histidine kinase [Rhizobium vallis]|uniref:histidine kinase n=1 Tax=Rhizobium vallis TaxID=634290 RepID=A0A3S0Y1H4_9HYPH|nr:HAMP domain-containing sensor histidine kinase [Rhizobium vallis]RUM20441.1 sensor histidine kinase [Rhizobium vallis]